jgi:hypothetical protein
LVGADDVQKELEEMKIIPLLNLLKKSRSIKIKLQYESFRKLNRFYKDVC